LPFGEPAVIEKYADATRVRVLYLPAHFFFELSDVRDPGRVKSALHLRFSKIDVDTPRELANGSSQLINARIT
jgi:hypothetical protein